MDVNGLVLREGLLEFRELTHLLKLTYALSTPLFQPHVVEFSAHTQSLGECLLLLVVGL
jgi:hypothetical protein